jgi:alpha-D-xyloside xylohydrolase
LHGSTSYRVPWVYDDEAVDVLRFFTRLKHRLMPYLWAKSVEAHHTGTPVMRAMHLEFPNDPACDTLDRQYMLGDALLVAPVFTLDGTVEYYVPEGEWTNILTGQQVEGGKWHREKHGVMSLPVLARHGCQIPVSLKDDSIEDAFEAELGVLEFGGEIPTVFDKQGRLAQPKLTNLLLKNWLQS